MHKQTKYTSISEETKQRVWCRDAGTCLWCGRRGPYVLPEAHYIPRSKGGLGIPENVLTLCRVCHHNFDNGDRRTREMMRDRFREYLKSHYSEWDEAKLVYHKEDFR